MLITDDKERECMSLGSNFIEADLQIWQGFYTLSEKGAKAWLLVAPKLSLACSEISGVTGMRTKLLKLWTDTGKYAKNVHSFTTLTAVCMVRP